MDAYLTGSTDVRYSDAAPILIAGTSDEALGSAASFLEASGARIGGRVPIDVAPRRIEEQVCSSAIWIEVDRDCGPALDVLIEQVNRELAQDDGSARRIRPSSGPPRWAKGVRRACAESQPRDALLLRRNRPGRRRDLTSRSQTCACLCVRLI